MNHIIGGDFNLVLNVEKDSKIGKQIIQNLLK